MSKGTPNDVNVPVKPRVAFAPQGAAAPQCFVSTSFSGSNSQMGRVFRDAIPSTCPSKAYPGIFNPGTPYFYETYAYPNNTGSAVCTTINFDPNPDNNLATDCDTNAHASAYIGSYDPMNQSANFVGDVGSSITDSFSFEVPAMSNLILVVTNTSAEEVCNYAFEVVALECTGNADLNLQKTVDRPSVSVGDMATYTLTISNDGETTATNTVVTDTLPAGVTYESNDCGASFADPTVTWNVGSLAPAASAVCNITVTVDSLGELVNVATATSDSADPVSANNSSTAILLGSEPVPTLSEYGILAMLLGLGAVAMWRLRRRAA